MNDHEAIFHTMFSLQQHIVSQLNGSHVDLYHSEEHGGILAVLAGKPLVPQNVIYKIAMQTTGGN